MGAVTGAAEKSIVRPMSLPSLHGKANTLLIVTTNAPTWHSLDLERS